MLRESVVAPQSEAIRAIVLEDSPCCEVSLLLCSLVLLPPCSLLLAPRRNSRLSAQLATELIHAALQLLDGFHGATGGGPLTSRRP